MIYEAWFYIARVGVLHCRRFKNDGLRYNLLHST
jgi:hypothetical protein